MLISNQKIKLSKELAVEEHAEDFECPRCEFISSGPWVVCSECGATYCQPCLEVFRIKEDEICLKCNYLTKMNPLKNLPALNRITFSCPNKERGCFVETSFKKMLNHVETCSKGRYSEQQKKEVLTTNNQQGKSGSKPTESLLKKLLPLAVVGQYVDGETNLEITQASRQIFKISCNKLVDFTTSPYFSENLRKLHFCSGQGAGQMQEIRFDFLAKEALKAQILVNGQEKARVQRRREFSDLTKVGALGVLSPQDQQVARSEPQPRVSKKNSVKFQSEKQKLEHCLKGAYKVKDEDHVLFIDKIRVQGKKVFMLTEFKANKPGQAMKLVLKQKGQVFESQVIRVDEKYNLEMFQIKFELKEDELSILLDDKKTQKLKTSQFFRLKNQLRALKRG